MLELQVSNSGSVAAMSGAILLYGGQPSIATVHKVDMIQGRPEIMPGRLLRDDDLVRIAAGVASAGASDTTQWIDPTMLGKGPDRMIWWSPPGKRAMFFKASSHNKGSFDGYANCPIPGLVWMAMPGSALYVYAVKGDQRPDQQTVLHQAPLFNVWSRGRICVGSAHLPSESEQGSQQAWEKVLFGSNFTHPNFTQANRLTKGRSPTKFWKEMVDKPTEAFPEDVLVRLPLTVGQLLERTVLDLLAKIPKAKGEF